MNKAFWSHFKHFGRLLEDYWKSSQPARCTLNLQPDLLGSFPADVCPDINGQFGCGQTAEFSPSGRGGGGGWVATGNWVFSGGWGGRGEWGRGFWQHIAAISDIKFLTTLSFQGHIITSTSPSHQKIARRTDILWNRSIGCPCLL